MKAQLMYVNAAQTTTILPPLPEDPFCAHSGISSPGAAGYSYKWAEVLSADAFAALKKLDWIQSWLSRHWEASVIPCWHRVVASIPMEVFKSFRDREPSTEPLLRHSSLLFPLKANPFLVKPFPTARSVLTLILQADQ